MALMEAVKKASVIEHQASKVMPRAHDERDASSAQWRRLGLALLATDFLCVFVASFVGLGAVMAELAWAPENYRSPYGLFVTVLLVIGWMWALSLTKTRDRRIVGVGSKEYKGLTRATWRTFAVLAIVSYALDLTVTRNHVLIAFPLGLALLLLERRLWRARLHRLRMAGEVMSPTLVAGHRDNIKGLIKTFQNQPKLGYKVIAACVPWEEVPAKGRIRGVPVVGYLDNAADLASELGVDVVAVTGSDETTADFVRSLGWALSPHKIDLVLASSLTDVAGPRIVVTPVEGARLVHVDAPEFTGPKYIGKTLLDTVGASLALVVLAPLFLVIAIAVKVTSPGPVFFKQVRIGRDGKPFTMYKFRSMVTGSEARLDEVIEGDVGMFYKAKTDSRVTSVGRVLRRTSLDELPQLINVVKQEMSLVGPRPQVEREVALYDGVISRRLLVKPGLTGKWQISGRSDLPLDESIRHDLNYVENWSLIDDLLIIFKTFKAIVRGAGAY